MCACAPPSGWGAAACRSFPCAAFTHTQGSIDVQLRHLRITCWGREVAILSRGSGGEAYLLLRHSHVGKELLRCHIYRCTGQCQCQSPGATSILVAVEQMKCVLGEHPTLRQVRVTGSSHGGVSASSLARRVDFVFNSCVHGGAGTAQLPSTEAVQCTGQQSHVVVGMERGLGSPAFCLCKAVVRYCIAPVGIFTASNLGGVNGRLGIPPLSHPCGGREMVEGGL